MVANASKYFSYCLGKIFLDLGNDCFFLLNLFKYTGDTWSVRNEYAKLLVKQISKCPEGFPPGIWVILKEQTIVMHKEEMKFKKTMFENTVRKCNLETEILKDATELLD